MRLSLASFSQALACMAHDCQCKCIWNVLLASSWTSTWLHLDCCQNGCCASASRISVGQDCTCLHQIQEPKSANAFGLPCALQIASFLMMAAVAEGVCHVQLLTRRTTRLLAGNQRLQRWCFDVELIYVAQKLGIPIAEVSVNWTEIPGELSRLPSRAAKLIGIHSIHECISSLLEMSTCKVDRRNGVPLPAHWLHANGS